MVSNQADKSDLLCHDDDDNVEFELKEGADADAVDGGQVGTKLSDWT